MKNRYVQIIESWKTLDNRFNDLKSLLKWIKDLNDIVSVKVEKIDFNNDYWYYDESLDKIVNRNGSFFSIEGIKRIDNNETLDNQIIINQPEIGYLGILAKEFDGKLYFLMQAKIEPGNINKVQISPTLQATRSNFMKTHGGGTPKYLEYFIEKDKYEILIDQIQSEQSSRFFRKRNRNIIIIVDEDIEIDNWHKWMTLGQIKELMRFDNLVNMDTRTVISCIPFSLRSYSDADMHIIKEHFVDDSFFNSVFDNSECGSNINKVFHYINNKKMFDFSKTSLVGISELSDWTFNNKELFSNKYNYKAIFCDIEIEGREVRKWQQPLFESLKPEIFGIICTVVDNKLKFLVRVINEVGCFDKYELGPTVQSTEEHLQNSNNYIDKLFYNNFIENYGIVFKGIFSEEGGRFFHEQNINIILKINNSYLKELPDGYFLLDYYTLNLFMQFNNCLNIQLRNLLSILSI